MNMNRERHKKGVKIDLFSMRDKPQFIPVGEALKTLIFDGFKMRSMDYGEK